MKLLTMQPAFTMEVPLQGGELMARVRKVIQSPELRDQVKSAGDCIDLSVDASEQRFWSPHLNVMVSELETGSQLHCRFSPRPEVWTMVMMIYFVATFIITGAAIYAYVQWFLGQTPWSLALIPTATFVIVALHAASLIGQGLSSDQMDQLRGRLDETLAGVLAAGDHHASGSEPGYRVDQATDSCAFKPRNGQDPHAVQHDPDEQLQ